VTLKLKIADTAFCVGITAKQLRKWMERGQVSLPNVRPTQGDVAQFDDLDISYLALMVPLIEFGMSILSAAAAIGYAFKDIGTKTEERDPIARWKGMQIWVRPGKDGKSWNIGVYADEGVFTTPATLILDAEQRLAEVYSRVAVIRARKVA
jgi:MerR HTH family regulatory protein